MKVKKKLTNKERQLIARLTALQERGTRIEFHFFDCESKTDKGTLNNSFACYKFSKSDLIEEGTNPEITFT